MFDVLYYVHNVINFVIPLHYKVLVVICNLFNTHVEKVVHFVVARGKILFKINNVSNININKNNNNNNNKILT